MFPDALQKRPTVLDFKDNFLDPLMKTILLEIKAEPNSCRSQKGNFLDKLLNMGEDTKWLEFVQKLGDIISEIVLKKYTKIMPADQYEEMQKTLNTYLNQNIDSLEQELQHICDVDLTAPMAGRLIFRMTSKLLQGTYKWALQKMRPTLSEEDQICLNKEMTEIEEKGFLIEVGGMLRKFYKKGLRKSEQWQMRSHCIKEKFVEGQQPISRSQFLNESNWFSGEELCIVPSQHAVSFFKSIELDIIPATVNNLDSNEVMENILAFPDLLNSWYYLTRAHFAEESSLLFLREFVTSYVKMSSRFEEKRSNRLHEKDVRSSTTALRTHLQHNFVARDEEEDEDLI